MVRHTLHCCPYNALEGHPYSTIQSDEEGHLPLLEEDGHDGDLAVVLAVVIEELVEAVEVVPQEVEEQEQGQEQGLDPQEELEEEEEEDYLQEQEVAAHLREMADTQGKDYRRG